MSTTIVDIASRMQCWFNTRDLVPEAPNIRILQQRPVKHPANPVLVADRPWEGTVVQLYSPDVHHDPATGRWQMWYEGHPGPVLLCTAFSEDGIRWIKPALGLQEWRGSRANNIILQTGYTDAHCASLVRAPTEQDPARRYKLYYWVGPAWFESHIEPMGLAPEEAAAARARIKAYAANGHYVAFSPDGIHFTPHLAQPALATSDFNTTLFDELTGRYRSYHKIEHKEPGWGEVRRCMWTSESDNGVDFGKSRLVLAPDAADDELARTLGGKRAEFYGMHVWPHGDFYLGLLWIFTITGGNAKYGMGWDDGRIEPQLIYSADGIAWQRMPVREPFIPHGPAGSFEAGSVYSAGDHPVVIGDEVRFYYFGVSYTHGCTDPVHSPNNYSGFGLATLPRDRYAGWQAGTHEGVLTTQPLKFTGSELRLNLDAGRGYVRAALLDEGGQPLPGFGFDDCTPLAADSLDCTVRWKGGSLPALRGKPVRLAFALRQSALYTWRFK